MVAAAAALNISNYALVAVVAAIIVAVAYPTITNAGARVAAGEIVARAYRRCVLCLLR